MSYETIVVVNGPHESLATELRESIHDVEVVESRVNRGVAGGYNLGRASAVGEFVLVLHDDVEVEHGWLDALIDGATRHPEAGIIGSKALFAERTVRSAGMVLWSNATTANPWDGDDPPFESYDEPRFVDYCSSCSLLVRTSLWDAVGGFNEDLYPAYFADVDLALSARRLGSATLYWPNSTVIHHRGSRGGERWRGFIASKNQRRFIDRWSSDLDLQPSTDVPLGEAVRLAGRWPRPTSSLQTLPTKVTGLLDEEWFVHRQQTIEADYRRHLEASMDHLERRIEELELGMAAQIGANRTSSHRTNPIRHTE